MTAIDNLFQDEESSDKHPAATQERKPDTATLTPSTIFRTNASTLISLVVAVGAVVMAWSSIGAKIDALMTIVSPIPGQVQHITDVLMYNHLDGPSPVNGTKLDKLPIPLPRP